MERRLAAILAADVVGYSHLMAEDEAGTYDALRSTLSEIVIPTVERHGGDLFKTTGDGFLASFNSVGEALEAAVAIQEAFASRPLRLRIGINLGDVIPADGDVFGDGVNIAARLESMAEPGGIYVSAPVVRSVGRNSGIRFVRLGLRRAKNMAEPIEVFAARWGAAGAPPSWPRWRPALGAATAAIAILAVAGTGWTYRDAWIPVVSSATGLQARDQAPVVAGEERPAVAVLPFDNLSGDPAQDYFSDGLTEDIITGLARNDELLVIARNSTFAYRDNPSDVRAVGAALGAGYVVEGSARRAGDRLRVTAQLVDTGSGGHLWSESYDRRIEDVFAVQADLTARIVAALVSHVGRSEAEAASSRPTESLRAYDLVLQGRQHQYGPFTAEALLRARDLFARALTLDPDYAAAHAYLGLTYVKDHALDLTGRATEGDLQTGLEHIREAIRLEPDLAAGYQALSFALAETGDYEGAMRTAERAVEINPNDPDTLESLAKAQVRFGDYEEAVANAERALRLHPFAPQYYPYVYGQALYAAGRYEDAENVL
ncbi:MAG TPA: tetratricopeptide repeat protein, partial [Geminicoccaceae bacterium]|nr:tetratricopeptide repeat protein [Geminicoccaceae bacterium]